MRIDIYSVARQSCNTRTTALAWVTAGTHQISSLRRSRKLWPGLLPPYLLRGVRSRPAGTLRKNRARAPARLGNDSAPLRLEARVVGTGGEQGFSLGVLCVLCVLTESFCWRRSPSTRGIQAHPVDWTEADPADESVQSADALRLEKFVPTTRGPKCRRPAPRRPRSRSSPRDCPRPLRRLR